MPEIIRGRHVTCVKETGHSGIATVAQYRRLIAELGGFARERCRPDADRCWSSGHAMRDNGLEAMCSMPVTPGLSAAASWFQEGERAWRP
ncbi:hypothetical protein [Streptomyces sp. UNOC14_S4]|uniref:hypothetical protein n=1 Tax=Streptomyces sp. UNOC14_S4 TaxID=2872340 RepID=UPI001E374991|nr:hypothetical protein [Streptomyces sp. UNOC14_S4]MCC3769071.1 hypothetical protein [Streptomyces sp. UNOC14_S4]